MTIKAYHPPQVEHVNSNLKPYKNVQRKHNSVKHD